MYTKSRLPRNIHASRETRISVAVDLGEYNKVYDVYIYHCYNTYPIM